MSGLEASPACNAGFCNNDLRYATREKVTGIWSNGERDIRCTAYGEQAQKGEKAHYSLNSCLVRVHCIKAGHAYHTESTLTTLIQTSPVHNEETQFLQSYSPSNPRTKPLYL